MENSGAARHSAPPPAKILTARRVRVQVGAGFVDLAAQFTPLVRCQAPDVPTGALVLLLLLLLLLAPLLVGPLIRHAPIKLARLGWRRRHAFGARLLLFAPVGLRLLLLRIILAVPLAITLGPGLHRPARACHRTSEHERADQAMAAADADIDCCMTMCERDIHGVPLP
ncbi:MAG: hypothetical protein H7335_12330 [Massilia sp.]|nr:hypothetical protein [Massilia sp.]